MGAASPQNIVKDVVGTVFAPVTGGASLGSTSSFKKANPFKSFQGVVDNLSGKSTRDAQKATNDLLGQQMAAQNQLQKDLLAAPKKVTSDNFLAMKNKQLSNLRLGFLSTITGASGTPSPVLSSTALASGQGKTKLGQ